MRLDRNKTYNYMNYSTVSNIIVLDSDYGGWVVIAYTVNSHAGQDRDKI